MSMVFIMPGVKPERVEHMILEIADGDRSRLVAGIEYRHEGRQYEVSVGSRRRVRRVIAPRGRKNYGYPEQLGEEEETGAPVFAIVLGKPIYVHELPSSWSPWANPSLVGVDEVLRITRFSPE